MRYVRINSHLQITRNALIRNELICKQRNQGFILYTRHYQTFCKQACGGMLHHTPAVVLAADKRDNTGLRRVWWQTCKEENINPRKPSRLPLLFALDAKLGIDDGFHYTPDCSALRRHDPDGGTAHCGGD